MFGEVGFMVLVNVVVVPCILCIEEKHKPENFQMPMQVAGHDDVLAGNPTLKQRLRLREPYITPLNVQQAYTLKKMREENKQLNITQNGELAKPTKRATELVKLNTTTEYAPGLEDTLILTMKGIAAGMQNTG